MKRLLTAKQVAAALDRLYETVARNLPPDNRIAVVGLRARGDILAQRLVDRLAKEHPELTIDFGVLDITFYRDDLHQRLGAPVVRATEIEFDPTDVWLLLVDDVLATGRSVRAALDALSDFGRPKAIRLGVLIDRGGHELPISADYVGRKLRVATDQRIQLKLKESDGEEGVFIFKQDE